MLHLQPEVLPELLLLLHFPSEISIPAITKQSTFYVEEVLILSFRGSHFIKIAHVYKILKANTVTAATVTEVTEINPPRSAQNVDGIWTFAFPSSFAEKCVFLLSFSDSTLLHHRVFWLIAVGAETSSSHGMSIS